MSWQEERRGKERKGGDGRGGKEIGWKEGEGWEVMTEEEARRWKGEKDIQWKE